jgi:hypothetical protein
MEKRKYTLADALKLINTNLPHLTVTSIEFEDGSMRKFIVGIKGYSNKSYMNMDTVEKYKP